MLVRNGQDLAIQLRVDFEDLDDDSSGGLTFEEARGVGKQAVGILDLTQGDFDQIDQDQNGELSGEELDLCSRALGVNWNELQHDVPWVNATSSPHVSFNGQLWVFGHWDEIWHSPDGIVWTLAEETTPWGSRGNGTCVVHNGMIWRMGGFDSYNWEEKNDVWYSSDGTTWTEATGAAPWNARWFHSSVVFDGKLWIMGGLAHDNLNDVWYSADGMNWTEATSAAPWCPRDGHSSVVFAGKMWLMGGWASNKVELNDVWSSSDGTNWTEVTNAASWIGRYDFASLVHEGKIWILGGSGDWSHGSYLRNDVWNSSDGLNWTQVTAAAQWSPRDQLTALVHDEKMIVMGGYSEDIWKGFTYSLGPPGEWRRQQRQWIDEKLEESNDDVWREGVGVEVMLTFDDGPHAAPPDGGSNRTQKVLNTLANYTRNGKSQSVKVTFFVQTHARDGEGQYYRGMHPNGREMLKRIDAAGHEIGIHTGSEQDHAFHWQRATLANNTTETEPYDINEPEYWPADGNPDGRNALASDLIRAKAFLEWLPDTDITPNWVRPPGGETWWDSDPEPSPNIVKETYGYYADPQVEPILYLGPKKFGGAYETGSNWHVDSGDSAEGATLQQVIENLGKRIPKKLLNHTKVVILFHDINEVTSEGSPPNTNLKQYLDTIWDVLDANGRVPTFVVLPDPPFPEALSPSS
jgi:peptidoglycan/xylan/chitin deacetylase (PgdA/CDA1 family)